jgi:C1A family cysteine protease
MQLSKIAIIAGITMIGLIGTINYMTKEDLDTVIDIKDATSEIQQRLQLYREWMKKYNKVYGVGEAPMRFAIWNKAYEFAQEHNAKGLSWTCGVNQFSDLTREEFSAMYLGYNWNPNRERTRVKLLDESSVPTSVDWRTQGAVTPIKNQGQCGSCWSFSTTGSLEGLHFLNNGTLVSFSEQQLVDCSSSYGNSGCNGGLMDNAFKYVEAKGIEQESTYPYKAASGTCQYVASKTVFKNTGYSDVTAKNPTQLKAAVALGPVSIAIEADQSAFQQYTNGTISSNCGTSLDHGVLIVGYTSSYWIVKNSWGTSWGEQGYVNIASGTQNNGAGVCGINSEPSYPTL